MIKQIKQHDCKAELREADLKATPARLAVLKLLEETQKPIDVNTIIDYLNHENIKTDPATVFRIMNTFTQKGITTQIQFQEGKARYELLSRGDHHHLICQKCENIEDISECVIPQLEKEITKKKKFLVKSHSLEFFGLCKQCQY